MYTRIYTLELEHTVILSCSTTSVLIMSVFCALRGIWRPRILLRTFPCRSHGTARGFSSASLFSLYSERTLFLGIPPSFLSPPPLSLSWLFSRDTKVCPPVIIALSCRSFPSLCRVVQVSTICHLNSRWFTITGIKVFPKASFSLFPSF